MNSNGFARITTAAIGAAGVVGAHSLAYRLAHSSHGGHDHALESAGHGYWDLAILLGVAALIIGIGVEIAFGGRQTHPQRPPLSTWLRLFALQGLTFASLESLERAIQGGGAAKALVPGTRILACVPTTSAHRRSGLRASSARTQGRRDACTAQASPSNRATTRTTYSTFLCTSHLSNNRFDHSRASSTSYSGLLNLRGH